MFGFKDCQTHAFPGCPISVDIAAPRALGALEGFGVASGIKETQLFMETSRAAMEHSHISCSVCQCAHVLYITRYLQLDAMHPIQADFIKSAFERRTKQTSFRHAAFRSITGYLHETVLLYESTLSLPRMATKIV